MSSSNFFFFLVTELAYCVALHSWVNVIFCSLSCVWWFIIWSVEDVNHAWNLWVTNFSVKYDEAGLDNIRVWRKFWFWINEIKSAASCPTQRTVCKRECGCFKFILINNVLLNLDKCCELVFLVSYWIFFCLLDLHITKQSYFCPCLLLLFLYA